MKTQCPHPSRRRLCLESLERRYLLTAFTLTDEEQMLVELINQARADPVGAAAILGIDLNQGLSPGTISSSAKQPLAPHPALIDAARAHSRDMIDRDFFDHINPDQADPGDRIRGAGYSPSSWGENVSGIWGFVSEPSDVVFHHWALFESPGHRRNLLSPGFREIGVGAIVDQNSDLLTEVFASRSGNAFVTGVAFEDRDANSLYSVGEGVGDLTITARSGSTTYTTTTGPSGGYSMRVPAGTYELTALGVSIEPIVVSSVTIGSANVKLDFVVTPDPIAPDPYEPNDRLMEATDLGSETTTVSGLTIHHPNDVDYFAWTSDAAGHVTIDLIPEAIGGDIDLFLLSGSGIPIAESASDTDRESITIKVAAETPYYIQVAGYGGAVHRGYTLAIARHEPPQAVDDGAMTDPGVTIDIDVAANDSAPGSPLNLASVGILSGAKHGQAVAMDGGIIRYTPTPDFVGVDTIVYQIENEQGVASEPARVFVHVGALPEQNPLAVADVDGDGWVTALDALLVINYLSRHAAGQSSLPVRLDRAGAPYFDVNGDGVVSSLDALVVINTISRQVQAEGERFGLLQHVTRSSLSLRSPDELVDLAIVLF